MRSLLLFFSVVAVGARAANEDMKNTRDGVRQSFPVYVDASYDNYVYQYQSLRTFDYFSYLGFLTSSLKEQVDRLHQTRDELERLKGLSLEDQGPLYEWRVARLQVTVAEIERQVVLLTNLSQAWKQSCDDQGMSFARGFYDPKILFPIDNLKVDHATAGYNFTLSYTFPFGNGSNGGAPAGSAAGGPQGTSGGGAAATNDVRDAVITGGCIAAGAAVGSILPGIGTYVGAQIGALVGSLTVGLLHGFTAAAEENERWDLLAEIRSIMSGVVANKAQQAPALLTQSCQQTFVEGTSAQIISAQIDAVLAQARDRLAEAQTYLGTEQEYLARLSQEARQRLHELKDTYFANLVHNYQAAADQYLQDTLKRDEDARKISKEKIFPRLKVVRDAPDAAQRTIARDALWDELIAGDALQSAAVNGDGQAQGFSFVPGNDDGGRTRWSSVVKLVQEGLAP